MKTPHNRDNANRLLKHKLTIFTHATNLRVYSRPALRKYAFGNINQPINVCGTLCLYVLLSFIPSVTRPSIHRQTISCCKAPSLQLLFLLFTVSCGHLWRSGHSESSASGLCNLLY